MAHLIIINLITQLIVHVLQGCLLYRLKLIKLLVVKHTILDLLSLALLVILATPYLPINSGVIGPLERNAGLLILSPQPVCP